MSEPIGTIRAINRTDPIPPGYDLLYNSVQESSDRVEFHGAGMDCPMLVVRVVVGNRPRR